MDDRYQIRPATAADARDVGLVERACFTDPWSETGLGETLQYETTAAFVAVQGERIAGYVMARISGEEAEILNLAVLLEDRRQGIARALLEAGLRFLAEREVTEVYLEVRESNLPAINLYRGFGFRPVALRPDYYRSPREDAIVLRLGLEVARK